MARAYTEQLKDTYMSQELGWGNAKNISVELVEQILRDAEDAWKPPDEWVAEAIRVAAESDECNMDDDEKLIKGWCVVSHNSMGKEQERICLASTKAFYRVKYDFAKRKTKSADRCVWENLELITYGQFRYSKGMFPSLGQILLSKDLNKLYGRFGEVSVCGKARMAPGFRIFYKNRPDSAGLPIPFKVEQYVDKCFRTFRPVIPESIKTEAEQHTYMERVSHEIAFTMLCLLRATRGDTFIPANEATIDVSATMGLVATVHNKGKMGVQDHFPKEGHVPEEEGDGKEKE